MKRLTHIAEERKQEAKKGAGIGAALAVAGLMGLGACATTAAVTPPPRYTLAPEQSAVMIVRDTQLVVHRLAQTIPVLENASRQAWTEERIGGRYSSSYMINVPDRMIFIGTAFVEEDSRWYFSGAIPEYRRFFPGSTNINAQLPPQMILLDNTGACMMDAEPFRALVKTISGRDVMRMKPLFYNLANTNVIGIHFLPLDSEGNRIGQYLSGQLAMTTSLDIDRPEIGCNRGITLLVEPSAEDPRNLQK